MKYNWPAVVKEFHTMMLENVKLYAHHDDPKVDSDLMEYLRFEMQETDAFHPWDNDGQLSRALDKMPARCDYRSCKSYWAYKEGKENISDALYNIFQEMDDIIYCHFNEWRNFAPGFALPEDIVFDNRDDYGYHITDKMAARIIRAAKK